MGNGEGSSGLPVAATRVYAYVVRGGRVLVFDHADPDAGVQVPGGGVEPGESFDAAVRREVLEESGVRCRVVADLGETRRTDWLPGVGAFTAVRRMFHVEPIGAVADVWTWTEDHASDGGRYEFEFRWLPVADAAAQLDFGFGERLGALSTGDPGTSAAGTIDDGASDGGASDSGDAADVVRDGYDRLAARYPEWSRESARRTAGGNVRHLMIDRALALGATGPALDVGCGTGELSTARLTALGLEVVGVDLSAVSIGRAASALPDAELVVADVTALSLPLRHFGLVTAFNSVIHVPRRRHAALYRDVRRWLRPGGLFVVNVERDGASGEGTTERWIDGVEMFWSGWSADEEIGLLERAGFELVEVSDGDDPAGPFTWLICRRSNN